MNDNPPAKKRPPRRSGTRSIETTFPRVLFVDDVALVARAFSRSMTHHGFDVTIASSGREALELAANQRFDVLVTDLSMPGMDGIALIDQLRRTGSQMAYVIATGHSEICVRGEYALAGPEITVVYKPWNDADLAETLHRLIASSDVSHEQVG